MGTKGQTLKNESLTRNHFYFYIKTEMNFERLVYFSANYCSTFLKTLKICNYFCQLAETLLGKWLIFVEKLTLVNFHDQPTTKNRTTACEKEKIRNWQCFYGGKICRKITQPFWDSVSRFTLPLALSLALSIRLRELILKKKCCVVCFIKIDRKTSWIPYI